MNTKLLLLVGVVSVLSMNGVTVHADSTVSTNGENLLVNTSTNADGSTNYEGFLRRIILHIRARL